MIGISGIPGSGKSTLARKLADHLNAIYRTEKQKDSGDFAVDIPMDGYHFSREKFASMTDPHVAIHRRGAAFTFDAEEFCRLVQQLHEPVPDNASIIYAPSFDHAIKDPVADTIAIWPSSRIVTFEGNYISLDREPWKSAARLMDERWFVNIDKKTARERLAKRHVASGIVLDEEAAYHRIDFTDLLNADDVLQNRLEVHEEISGDS